MDVRGDWNIDTNDDTYVDTAVYNTQAYKDAGYGLYTLTNDTQALKLSGNTLYLNATQNNDQYVLITGDTKFFVENTDDPDNGYELYPNASSALAALGTGNLISKNGVPANKALIAMICDTATGYAKTIIIRDHKYEGGNTPGPVDPTVNSAYVYENASGDFFVRVKLSAPRATAITYNYRVIARNNFTGTSVAVASGQIAFAIGDQNLNSAKLGTGVIGNQGLFTYYVELDGNMYTNYPGPITTP